MFTSREVPMLRNPKPRATQVVRSGDLIPDNRLLPNQQDLLGHEAIAKGVAEIALTAEKPVNIALYGAWGAGKSSIYSMIETHLHLLSANNFRIARYDAWKYGGKELKRNFVDSLTIDLGLDHHDELSYGLERSVNDTRIQFGQWFWKNKRSLAYGLLFAIGVAAVWVLSIALATFLLSDQGALDTVRKLVPQVGTVFGLALLAALLGPKTLEGAVVTTETPAPEGGDQFAKRFATLISLAGASSHRPLIVFIDELDRCAPSDVVATLRDLKTFLDQQHCAFIVAADREVIVRALQAEVPQAKPIREDEPYYATPGAFLDKIFQHQIDLPPLRARALTEFALALANSQSGGIWQEMRNAGDDFYDRVIFALIPVHVRSPRRAKVLMNNFATNARIAEARGIPWLDRAHEIAILTVLQTEFPSTVSDLRRVPRLLSYLRGEEDAGSDEVRAIVEKYMNATDSNDASCLDTITLLTDDESQSGQRLSRNADATLTRQLHTYLGKVSAAQIQDPRPDLIYLQPAASRSLLPDPALGDAIDFATDTAPKQVVRAFDAQDSPILAIAIPLLVLEGDNAIGVGKQFAYEAACLLFERLEVADRKSTADQIQPSLLASVLSGSFRDESLPGLLLVSAWSESVKMFRELMGNQLIADVSDDVLRRFVPVLEQCEEAESSALIEILARRFEKSPNPLFDALTRLPTKAALTVWKDAQKTVVKAINELELPIPEGANDETPSAGPTTSKPDPTGDGVALLERLVQKSNERLDSELLVSAVFEAFQTRPASVPLIQWTLANFENFIAPLESTQLRAKHALLGIRAFQSGAWITWGTLLSPPAERVDAALIPLADEVLTKNLLPAFANRDKAIKDEPLSELTSTVFEYSSLSDTKLGAVTSETLADMPWSGNQTRGEIWSTKTIFYKTVLSLADDPKPDGLLPAQVVLDLLDGLGVYSIDPELVQDFSEFCAKLTPELCVAISKGIDKHEALTGDASDILHLRLNIRNLAEAPPLPSSELLELDVATQSSAISTAWLVSKPEPTEVARVLNHFPLLPGAVRSYAVGLSVPERTSLWVAAEKAGCSDSLLRASGDSGIGAEAVDYIRASVKELSRESDRRDRVKRLRTAKAVRASDNSGAAQRSAEALARDLLSTGVSGDVRSAAEVMTWAGGAVRGSKVDLKSQFDRALKEHKKSITKSVFAELEALGLVSRNKSLRKRIFS
ncbi:MAG: P-loop NTPase fold protein [Corynebacteriales bacterium]|nr:P-loop NTPase fold protein [Mycobacteriales bacterium]